MSLSLIIQNSRSGDTYDVSETISSVSWSTQLEAYPGKLEFDLVETEEFTPYEGARVLFRYGEQDVFFGYIFSRSRSKSGVISITAYDQTRYLQNKDAMVFTNATASSVFEAICKHTQLEHKVVTPSSYKLPPVVYDDKSYYEMIQKSIDTTLINAGRWHVVRDVFGTIEFTEVVKLRTGLLITDQSLLSEFTYDSSIDDDTYNQVKIIHEYKEEAKKKGAEEKKKREVYLVQDSGTIAEWGLLQLFQKADEKMNAAQIKERANRLLLVKNRVTKSLTLECMGELDIRAGSVVIVDIAALANEDINGKEFVVTECTHAFSNAKHTMSLTVEVMPDYAG